VKQERLEFLAENQHYTKRFMYHIGKQCRKETIKELEKQYMREQILKAGVPRPKVVGIDEISIRKGHTYRIAVSDLERRRPIWFGGKDRSEESMDDFYAFLRGGIEQRGQIGCNGYVESISELNSSKCTTGCYLVRQISCASTSWRSA